MALSSIQTNNKLIKFREEILREFVRENMFSAYMGSSMTSIIRIMNDLKSGGEQVNIPLVNSLRGAAIANGTLTGAEEAIDNYGFRMWVDWARNAVKTNKQESQRDSADIFDIARPLLTDWGQELIKNEIVDALMSVPSASAPAGLGTAAGQRVNGTPFANNAANNTWVTDNADRILFGAVTTNTVAGNFTGSLANLDSPTDKLTAATVRLMKRRALSISTQRIRPIRTNDGYDYYVLFCDPNQFRDLAGDTTILNNHLYARPREGQSYKDNPLFMDGDILYDGVIVRQVPEMLTRRPAFFATAGASGTTAVNAAFLCGQSALAQFYGQLPRPTQLDQTDYQFNRGVGIEMCYGIGKVAKLTGSNLKDWGVFTGFFTSVADV